MSLLSTCCGLTDGCCNHPHHSRQSIKSAVFYNILCLWCLTHGEKTNLLIRKQVIAPVGSSSIPIFQPSTPLTSSLVVQPSPVLKSHMLEWNGIGWMSVCITRRSPSLNGKECVQRCCDVINTTFLFGFRYDIETQCRTATKLSCAKDRIRVFWMLMTYKIRIIFTP